MNLFAPYDAVKARWETDETFRKLARFAASAALTFVAGWAMDLGVKAVVLNIITATGLLINAGQINPIKK